MNGQQVNAWEYPATPENVARLQQVVKDLEIVHDYRSTNTERLQAQSVLSPLLPQAHSAQLLCIMLCACCELTETDFSGLIRLGTTRVVGDWRLH